MTDDEKKAELIANLRDRSAELKASLAGLSDAQMEERSLDGWSPKDHVSHCAVWHDIRASEVGRISAGYETAWPGMPTEVNNAFNETTVAGRRNLSLQQVWWEYDSALQRVIDALQSATPRGLDESLYGESPPRTGHDAQHAGWLLRWRGERGY